VLEKRVFARLFFFKKNYILLLRTIENVICIKKRVFTRLFLFKELLFVFERRLDDKSVPNRVQLQLQYHQIPMHNIWMKQAPKNRYKKYNLATLSYKVTVGSLLSGVGIYGKITILL